MQQQSAEKLGEFVRASKTRGASDEFLASLLTRRGWPADAVYSALGHYWEEITGVPVPERMAAGESSRDAFLYLLSFATLATWSGALGTMLFRFVDGWFPDPVSIGRAYDARSSVTWQMACIAVAFPIYLLVMRFILRESRERPERLDSGVKKWLTYIALLGTAGGMICDLIWFLDYFLQGEITARFILKSGTVMAICGSIFVYYLGSLRWKDMVEVAEQKRRNLWFGSAAVAAVAITFVVGLTVAGTPSRQRHLEADERRVQQLRGISYAVKAWHDKKLASDSKSELPGTVQELEGQGSVTRASAADPETGKPYEYHPRQDGKFEVCAEFRAPGGRGNSQSFVASDFWSHGAGRSCFVLDAAQAIPW